MTCTYKLVGRVRLSTPSLVRVAQDGGWLLCRPANTPPAELDELDEAIVQTCEGEVMMVHGKGDNWNRFRTEEYPEHTLEMLEKHGYHFEHDNEGCSNLN